MPSFQGSQQWQTSYEGAASETSGRIQVRLLIVEKQLLQNMVPYLLELPFLENAKTCFWFTEIKLIQITFLSFYRYKIILGITAVTHKVKIASIFFKCSFNLSLQEKSCFAAKTQFKHLQKYPYL